MTVPSESVGVQFWHVCCTLWGIALKYICIPFPHSMLMWFRAATTTLLYQAAQKMHSVFVTFMVWACKLNGSKLCIMVTLVTSALSKLPEAWKLFVCMGSPAGYILQASSQWLCMLLSSCDIFSLYTSRVPTVYIQCTKAVPVKWTSKRMYLLRLAPEIIWPQYIITCISFLLVLFCSIVQIHVPSCNTVWKRETVIICK